MVMIVSSSNVTLAFEFMAVVMISCFSILSPSFRSSVWLPLSKVALPSSSVMEPMLPKT